jgi:hypothetical protein
VLLREDRVCFTLFRCSRTTAANSLPASSAIFTCYPTRRNYTSRCRWMSKPIHTWRRHKLQWP